MIRLDSIGKQHGKQILFLEASASVNRGEKVGLVGPNGSGKTTIFRMITREEAPDGRVVRGRRHELDPALADEHRRRFDALLLQWLPVLEPGVEEALVGRDRLVEIGDGHADVVDPPHAPDSTRRPQSRMGSARTVPIVSDAWDSGTTSASRSTG